MKLKLPKNQRNGLKVWCRQCRKNNCGCKNYENHFYRMNLIDPITFKHSSKILKSKNYDDAIAEALTFKKDVKNNAIKKVETVVEVGNDYTLAEAILKYDDYLQGESIYNHLKKKVSSKHKTEVLNYLTQFHDSVKKNRKVKWIKPNMIGRADVSYFYGIITNRYKPKTINKIIQTLTTFFNFLIDIEDIVMKNYFKECIKMSVPKSQINIITKNEFDSILDAIDTCTPLYQTTKAGRFDKMNMSGLKNIFKLFLFIGGRREEVLSLKWNDIFVSDYGTKFFMIRNLKVERITNEVDVSAKLVPINSDLEDLLYQMGWDQKKDTDCNIIEEADYFTLGTLMEKVSDAFTHYRKCAGITKDITLKHLRKTYLTWTYQAMGENTGRITSHSGIKVLRDHYLDPQVLSTVETAALSVKIFG